MLRDQQIRLFGNARLVVGAHGAGLNNVVLGTPNVTRYEPLPDHDLNACISRLAQLHGVR